MTDQDQRAARAGGMIFDDVRNRRPPGQMLPVGLSLLIFGAACGRRIHLPDGRRWCRSLRGRLDLGFGELAAQVWRESRIVTDGREGRVVRPAVIGHQTSIGRDDVAGTQCWIIGNGYGDEAEGVSAVAGTAGDDLLPVRERGGKLRVALAIWRERVIDAVAAVDLGCTRRTKRAAGLRRICPAMALNWKVTSVA